MKQSLLNRTRAFVTLGLSAGLLIGLPAFAGSFTGVEDPVSKPTVKKAKSKTTTSRNNNVIKIYPDIIRRSMHVVAKGNDEIDFHVFDLQGTLVQSIKMKEKDHQQVSGLAKGRYLYRVFAGHEETANGQFEIR